MSPYRSPPPRPRPAPRAPWWRLVRAWVDGTLERIDDRRRGYIGGLGVPGRPPRRLAGVALLALVLVGGVGASCTAAQFEAARATQSAASVAISTACKTAYDRARTAPEVERASAICRPALDAYDAYDAALAAAIALDAAGADEAAQAAAAAKLAAAGARLAAVLGGLP